MVDNCVHCIYHGKLCDKCKNKNDMADILYEHISRNVAKIIIRMIECSICESNDNYGKLCYNCERNVFRPCYNCDVMVKDRCEMCNETPVCSDCKITIKCCPGVNYSGCDECTYLNECNGYFCEKCCEFCPSCCYDDPTVGLCSSCQTDDCNSLETSS